MAYATISEVQERMTRTLTADEQSVCSALLMGATQGSMSALGYSQSWTIGSGTVGELYLSKLEKKLLGTGDKIGSRSPAEDLVGGVCVW